MVSETTRTTENTPPPSAPAGWYDDAAMLGLKRYWDGAAWTERTSPAAQLPKQKKSKAALVIAITASLIAVLAIAGALSGSIPNLTASEVDPTQAPEPTATVDPIPAGDYSQFTESAIGDLDDLEKDLDDFEDVVDEGGYFRLLSNIVEVRFNLQQLRDTEAPDFFADDWDSVVDDLGHTIDDLSDAIGGSTADLKDAIAASREAAVTMREAITPLQ